MEIKHWSEKVIDEVEKKGPPYVISSGITTSGSTHLGTLCEFLYPSAIYEGLLRRGKDAVFYFQGDILDAFDNIPGNLKEHEEFLKEHLGKPLCDVPDPFKCCSSYGEHFLNEAKEIMEKLEVRPKVIRANEQYAKGLYDEHARLFLKNKGQAKEILEMSSFRKVPDDWSPVMVICEKCGKIATTRVVDYHVDEIEYSCDKDVGYAKGCGHKGKTRISEHRYKLVWRLDWPAKQDILKVSAEGGGKDHFTRGGSRDTLEAVFREMFKKEPPVGFRFGFITIGGKKYSKSKGLGLGVSEILELASPELLKYVLFKPPVEKDKDIAPTGDFLLKLYEEYNHAGKMEPSNEAEQKKKTAHKLASGKTYGTSFSDLLLYYQLYKDWELIKKRTGDPQTVEHLKGYIEKWVEKDIIPANLRFTYEPRKIDGMNREICEFVKELKEGMTDKEIHETAYEIIKKEKIKPADFFNAIYETLLGKRSGPRLGVLIHAIGSAEVKKRLESLYS